MSFEEGVLDQKEGLNLTTLEQEEIFRKFLEIKLKKEEGKYIQRKPLLHTKIWWKKE